MLIMKVRSYRTPRAIFRIVVIIFCTLLCISEIANHNRNSNQLIIDHQRSVSFLETILRLANGYLNRYFLWVYGQRRWYLSAPSSNLTVPIRDIRSDELKLWPDGDLANDRIESQLLIVPPQLPHFVASGNYSRIEYSRSGFKIIYLPDGYHPWHVKPGREEFLRSNCPVDQCLLDDDAKEADTADAVIFRNIVLDREPSKPHPNQIWILYILESPFHTPEYMEYSNVINWTATYRLDSTLVTPYEKFALYDPAIKSLLQTVNYAAQKNAQHKVMWIASNCHSSNRRMEYAMALSKYIAVDIYGKCGDKTTACQNDTIANRNACLDSLKSHYKFYLAFENSNCRWYITEKFWINALRSTLLPVVMGAPKSDYLATAPFNSFIHVDDYESPQKLADYLHYLDKNDTAYNQYFTWKECFTPYDNGRIRIRIFKAGGEKTLVSTFDGWMDNPVARPEEIAFHAQRSCYIFS